MLASVTEYPFLANREGVKLAFSKQLKVWREVGLQPDSDLTEAYMVVRTVEMEEARSRAFGSKAPRLKGAL